MAAKKKATKKKTKKKARKKAARRKSGGEVLVVASKVREQLKQAGCATGGDAVEGLNQWVGFLIGQAAGRAKANGRKTVRAHDFIV